MNADAHGTAPGVIATSIDALSSKFGCIYADPPWRYQNTRTRGSAANHYGTMSVDELRALPVADLAAKKSHLHLWTTAGFLREALMLIDAWGFEYKSQFVWAKPQIGLGNYWRNSHELMLLGVRGGLTFKDKSLRSWGEFNRRRHSAKPELVRMMIERASPGPYLELFGRKQAEGWTVWGNQVEKTLYG